MDQDIEVDVSPEFAASLKEFMEREEVAALIAAPLPRHLENMFR